MKSNTFTCVAVYTNALGETKHLNYAENPNYTEDSDEDEVFMIWDPVLKPSEILLEDIFEVCEERAKKYANDIVGNEIVEIRKNGKPYMTISFKD
jgi:hypothetical protein